jgi:hypothetical protein
MYPSSAADTLISVPIQEVFASVGGAKCAFQVLAYAADV